MMGLKVPLVARFIVFITVCPTNKMNFFAQAIKITPLQVSNEHQDTVNA